MCEWGRGVGRMVGGSVGGEVRRGGYSRECAGR